MPPSVFSSSEKALIKSVFPSASYKIITVSPARIYAAYPTPDRWYYLGVEGALAFVRDAKNTFHFKLVDLASTGTISWDHELYDEEGNTDLINVFSLEEKTEGGISLNNLFAGQ